MDQGNGTEVERSPEDLAETVCAVAEAGVVVPQREHEQQADGVFGQKGGARKQSGGEQSEQRHGDERTHGVERIAHGLSPQDHARAEDRRTGQKHRKARPGRAPLHDESLGQQRIVRFGHTGRPRMRHCRNGKDEQSGKGRHQRLTYDIRFHDPFFVGAARDRRTHFPQALPDSACRRKRPRAGRSAGVFSGCLRHISAPSAVAEHPVPRLGPAPGMPPPSGPCPEPTIAHTKVTKNGQRPANNS